MLCNSFYQNLFTSVTRLPDKQLPELIQHLIAAIDADAVDFFGDPFFWNGAWYAFMLDNTAQPPVKNLVTIQLGNPMIVDIVYTYSGTPCGDPMASIPSGPLTGIYGGALAPDCTGVDILFTNPNDTLGSIVAASSTPSFTFGPPLQTGVTYYFAAMAVRGIKNETAPASTRCRRRPIHSNYEV